MREAREVTSPESLPLAEKTGSISKSWRAELEAREERRSKVDW